MLDKLKVYLCSLSSYLGKCEERFAKFKTAHENILDRVSSAEKYFSNQLKMAQVDSNDAQKKHEEAVVASKTFEIATATLTMITSGSVAAGTLGVIQPELAAVQGMFNYFSCQVSRGNERKAVLNVMEQQRVLEGTAKKEKTSQDALNRVVKVYTSVSDAVSLIKEMKYNSDSASEVIDGLKEQSEFDRINFHDLEIKMEMLQDLY